MKKLILHLSLIVLLFFSTWFSLSQIDWVSVLEIKERAKSTEEKLGEMYWDLFRTSEKEIHSTSITTAIDSLVGHLCKHNAIDKSKIKLHVLNNEEINAFTLPNNHIVVYSGLIDASENEAELLGVLGHEMAHMEKGHLMKKLISEVGLSALISVSTGNKGGEIIKETAKLLSSSSYSRDWETEADMTSVEYLINANIDPEQFANFLFKLSAEESNIPSQMEWISTHPDSKKRAESIIEFIKDKKVTKTTVLNPEKWQELKGSLKTL